MEELEDLEKDELGWIDGNKFHPFYVHNKKYQHDTLMVCEFSGYMYPHRPVSNGFPVDDFYWKEIEYPVNLKR